MLVAKILNSYFSSLEKREALKAFEESPIKEQIFESFLKSLSKDLAKEVNPNLVFEEPTQNTEEGSQTTPETGTEGEEQQQTSTQKEVVELDGKGDVTIGQAETINAADGSFLFKDTAAQKDYVIIENFGQDDQICVDWAQISVQQSADDPHDAILIYNNNGQVSQIVLDDVLPDNALVYDVDSLEQALGFDAVTTCSEAELA